MKKKKITFEKLVEISKNANFISTKEKDKLTYALTRFVEANKKTIQSYNEMLEDARIDAAETDEKGILITDNNGNYQFTKEGRKVLTDAVKAINAKEVEISIYKCIDLTRVNELPIDIQYAMNGILFDVDFSEYEDVEVSSNGVMVEA